LDNDHGCLDTLLAGSNFVFFKLLLFGNDGLDVLTVSVSVLSLHSSRLVLAGPLPEPISVQSAEAAIRKPALEPKLVPARPEQRRRRRQRSSPVPRPVPVRQQHAPPADQVPIPPIVKKWFTDICYYKYLKLRRFTFL
jgi:hypothetical protein